MSNLLQAGFGRGAIQFPQELFPIEGFVGVHDVPGVRLMVLESGGVKIAIAALELVNLPPKGVELCQGIIERATGTPGERIWVHVTHAITTPHEPGPMGPPDRRPPETEEDRVKKGLFFAAIEAAVTQAAAQAADSFGPARLGWGTGRCEVNVNRDTETPFGWWNGQNPDGPSNKVMSILRVENLEGCLKGFWISYGIKPCAIDNAGMETGDRQVSADVCGVCSAMMEERFGVPAVFCVSAAGDQVPREQAWFEEAVCEGRPARRDFGVKAGLEIVAHLGAEMGRDAIAIAEGTVCTETEAPIRHSALSFPWPGKNGRPRGPGKPQKAFPAEGEHVVDAEIFVVGEAAFVAEKPEVNCQTELDLNARSPFPHTLLICMVNGGMKYMPDRAAYEHNTFACQSSMLQPGAAEHFVDVVTQELERLSAERPLRQTPPVEITAVAEPFPDGQKITKAILTFQNEVPDAGQITVRNRTIISRAVEGNTVTLELSPEDDWAFILPPPPAPKPRSEQETGAPPRRGELPPRVRRPVEVVVGIPGYGEEIRSTKTYQPIVEDFTQHEFQGIPYNLYVPENYDPAQKYPLVMFIPDASLNGDDPLLALVQGIGATCWAAPEEQAKHPCFVLAPQIPRGVRLTTNEHTADPMIEAIKDLLDDVVNRFSVDRDRIYATGQSQGCMAMCELNIRYPKYFAASLLVSGHWDIEKMTKLPHCHFLIGLSEGGKGEYPNMTAIVDGLEANGADVKRLRLNFRDGWAVNNAKVREVSNAQIIYIVFDKDTAFPDDGKVRPDIAHHFRGWELTYDMEAARDWLFAQRRNGDA